MMKMIVSGAMIAAVSLGDTRTIQFADSRKKPLKELLATHGSLYAMEGAAQKILYRGVPKKLRGTVRYCITFRHMRTRTGAHASPTPSKKRKKNHLSRKYLKKGKNVAESPGLVSPALSSECNCCALAQLLCTRTIFGAH